MYKKNCIPISIGFFSVLALQSYREIFNEYRKRANTLQKAIFQKFEKTFLDIHIWNVMPKLESSRFNGVAVITKTYTHTHIYCRT